MLDLVYEENREKVMPVWQRIFGDEPLGDGLHVLLRLEDIPIGVAWLNLHGSEEIVLHKLGIYEDLRGRGFGDFFFRSLFYMLTLCGNDFVVESTHHYFEKFHFVAEGAVSRVKAYELVFPSSCGGHHE